VIREVAVQGGFDDMLPKSATVSGSPRDMQRPGTADTELINLDDVQLLLDTLDDNITQGTAAIVAFFRANPGFEAGVMALMEKIRRWSDLRAALLSIRRSGQTLSRSGSCLAGSQ
jgi:hypothetical protein